MLTTKERTRKLLVSVELPIQCQKKRMPLLLFRWNSVAFIIGVPSVGSKRGEIGECQEWMGFSSMINAKLLRRSFVIILETKVVISKLVKSSLFGLHLHHEFKSTIQTEK